MWEKIKSHPWVVGGAVGLLLLVLVFSASSGSGATTTNDTATSDPNGDSLQGYLAALNQQGQATSLAADVQNNQTAAAVTVSSMQASSNDKANQLAAEVAEFNTSAGAQTQQLHDTLSAQVAENNNATQVNLQQINSTTLTTQATINAGVQNNLIDALENVQLGEENVQSEQIQAAKDVQTQSWTSKIFG